MVNGGNLRSDTTVTPDTVLGQVCVGDQVIVLDQREAGGGRWYRIQVSAAVSACVPERVAQGTEGWLSSSLISQPEVAAGAAAAAAPTNAPAASAVPIPTADERQPTARCTDLMRNKESMTDIQWKNFKETIKGTWLIDNPGTVHEVGSKSWLAGGYPIYIDISSDCDVYYVAPDEQTALRFSKGQKILITAQVNFVDEGIFGGMTYHLEHFTAEIR